MQILVGPGGQVRCVYEELIDLARLGEVDAVRASHVEPDRRGDWWADLSPVGGPRLGPFARRSLALAAELEWLLAHWLVPGGAAAGLRGGVDEDVRAGGHGRRRGPGAGGVPGLLPRREAVGRRRRGPYPEGAGA